MGETYIGIEIEWESQSEGKRVRERLSDIETEWECSVRERECERTECERGTEWERAR